MAKITSTLAIGRLAAIIVVVAVVVVAAAAAVFFLLPQPKTGVFNVTAREFNFDVNGQTNPTITVKVGEKVQIIFSNQGGLKHEFLIVSNLTSEVLVFNAKIDLLAHGQSGGITFVPDKPGNYFYACFSVDGTSGTKHAVVPYNMFGQFIVEP